MTQKITLLFLLMAGLFLSPMSHIKLWAQGTDCFRLECGYATGNAGDAINVDVLSYGFSDMIGFQYVMQWDPAVASLVDVIPIGIASQSSNFQYNEIEPGKLILLYTDPNQTGFDLADATIVYRLQMQLVGAAGTHTPIQFTNTPQRIEVIRLDSGGNISLHPFSGLAGKIEVGFGYGPLAMEACAYGENCIGANDASVEVNMFSGAMPFSYQWIGPNGFTSTDEYLSNLHSGFYTLTVTDANNVWREASFLTLGQGIGLSVDASITHEGCTTPNSGAIQILNVNSGQPPYTYQWSNGATTPSLTSLTAGTYSLTVTDNNGCTYSEDFEVQSGADDAFLIAASEGHPNCGTANGFVDLSVGTIINAAQLSYIWNTGATTEDLANVPAGRYSVTVTETTSGCSTEKVYALSDSILVTAIQDTWHCDQTLPVQVSGEIVVLNWWGDSTTFELSDGQIQSGSNVAIFEGLPPGTYTYTATDINGCQYFSDPIELNCGGNAACTPLFYGSKESIAPGAVSCMQFGINEYVPLHGAQFSLQWDPNQLNFVSAAKDNNLSPYLFVDFGTTETASGRLAVLLSEDLVNSPNLSNSELIFEVCFQTAPAFGGTAEVRFGNQPAAIMVLDKNLNKIGLQARNGVFTNDCTAPLVVNACVNPVDCDGVGGSIELAIDGGAIPPTMAFAWSGPNGFSAATKNLNGLEAGVYELQVSENGCTNYSGRFEILNAPAPEIQLVDLQHVSCAGAADGSVSITIANNSQSGYTYDWSDDTFDGQTTASGLGPGIISVRVTDANGCMALQHFTIIEPSPLRITDVTVSCESNQGNDGTIDIEVVGGVQLYQYAWNNGATTQNLVGLSAAGAPYALTLTDGNGCQLIESFELNVNEATILGDTVLCDTATVQLSAVATDVANYSWSPSTNLSCSDCPNPIAFVDQTTTYTLTIEYQDGCQEVDLVTLELNDCVWPGDTDTSGLVDHFDLLNLGIGMGSAGPARPNASIEWTAQPGYEWSEATVHSQINFKHIDTDGSGAIEIVDTTAILQNWGEEHDLLGGGAVSSLLQLPPFSGGLITVPFFVRPDTLYPGSSAELPIMLGEPGQPAEGVYGIAFSIEYDPKVVVSKSARVHFEQSWLGDDETDLIYIQKDFHSAGRIDVAVSRIDGQNITGGGQLGILFIVIEDDIFELLGDADGGRNGNLLADFKISNVLIINYQEERLEVLPQTTSSVILTNSTATVESWLDGQLRLFPNPADESIQLQFGQLDVKEVEIHDAAGKLIERHIPSNSHMLVESGHWPAGAYLVKVISREGILNKRITINH